MARDKKSSVKADYIQNGNFEGGKLEHWKVLSGDISVQQEGDRFYALLNHGSKLNQRFNITDVQPRQFVLTLDVRVENGSDLANGQAQVIWFSGLLSRPFNLVESAEWRTITIPVNVSSPSFTNNLEVLVQPRFDNLVSVRNISVRDQTGSPVKLDGAVAGEEKLVSKDNESVQP